MKRRPISIISMLAMALSAVMFPALAAAQQGLQVKQVWAEQYNNWSFESQQANTYIFNGTNCNSTPLAEGQIPAYFVFGTPNSSVYYPILIRDANATKNEVVTPTTVSVVSGACGFSAPTTNSHTSFVVSSGTAGLQDAVATLANSGSHAINVMLDRPWYQLIAALPGSPPAASIIAALKGGSTGVNIIDTTTYPWATYTWSGTQYLKNGTGAAPYTGLVATRTGELPIGITGADTWQMVAGAFYLRSAAPNGVRVVYPNWYINGSNVETNLTSPSTYKVSIEYPIGGTPVVCTFSGVQTITAAAATPFVTTDYCGPAMPNGALFRVRMLFTNVSGIPNANGNTTHFSTLYDFREFGTGAPDDKTAGGTLTNSGAAGGANFFPIGIVALTTRPSVCIVGDSRAFGSYDTPDDNTLDISPEGRSIGPVFAYSDLGRSGTTAAQATTNYTNRASFINSYCSHVIDEYGVNDVTANTAAATIVGYRATLAALWPNVVTFGETIPAKVADTQPITSVANPTGSAAPYSGTFAHCGSNACVGLSFTVTGFVATAANNGTFPCTASTTSTLTLTNPSAVAETHTAASTDSFTSVINQTLLDFSPDSLNALLRTPGVTGELDQFDLENFTDPAQNDTWPVSRVPGAATGTVPFFFTNEGVHENSNGNLLIKQAGVIRTGEFTR
jgi:hypothetical protein